MTSSAERPQRVLGEGLLHSAFSNPEKVAVVVEGVSYTYQQLLDAASSLASALRTRGVKRGDRVAIYMDNSWPCVVSIYGVILSGGVFVLINPQTKAEKLLFLFENSETRIVIADGRLASIFVPVVQKCSAVECVIYSGVLSREPDSDLGYDEFDIVISEDVPSPPNIHVIPLDLAALIYTSGSTGTPKGVMQTHQSMVFAAWSVIEYLRLSASDRIMLVLPLAFDYGLYQLLMTIKLGATLIVERSFTFPAQIYKRMLDESVTVFPGVPTIFAMMIATSRKKKLIFPSITRVTNTAAALSASFIPQLKGIFPNALIYKMYGQTECKRVSYLEPELVVSNPASVGKAIPGTEVFLLSPDGQPAKVGEAGILHVRGPHVMAGYWKQPEMTARMLKEGLLPGERILCTHDWFHMDQRGLLYFEGRSDDIIKTKGEKVSPLEVENALHAIDGIKEAAVLGIVDEVFGQAVKAFVVVEDDSEFVEKKIKKICLTKMENYMVPQSIVCLEEMPKTQNGKIDKIYLSTII